jgi:hypothetical protein
MTACYNFVIIDCVRADQRSQIQSMLNNPIIHFDSVQLRYTTPVPLPPTHQDVRQVKSAAEHHHVALMV